MDGMKKTLWDPVIASPQRSQDGIEQKPSMALPEEPLQIGRGKSPGGASPKSPLAIRSSSENSPRSWRSSPKVCSGEDDLMYDTQIPDTGFYIFSPVNDELILKPESMMDNGRSFRSPIGDERKRKIVYIDSMEASQHGILRSCLLPLCSVEDQTNDAIKEKLSPLSSKSAPTQLNLSSKLLMTNSASVDLQNVSECQQEEVCAYVPPQNMLDQPISHLTALSLNEESVQFCGSGEEEVSMLVCQTTHDSKAIDVDGSNNESVSSSSLSVISSSPPSALFLLLRSTSLLPSSSSSFAVSSPLALSSSPPSLAPSLLPSIASPSSLSESALSLPVSGSSSSSLIASASSSSALLGSGLSLSQLMSLDLPRADRVEQSPQVNNYAKTQRNLAMLGFSSMCSDNLSIFEQAKAHRRAHLGNPLKQEQEWFHPSKQQRGEKEDQGHSAWPRTSRPGRLPCHRIRDILMQRRKKPLSPIPEVSPELSPASFSPQSGCSLKSSR